MQEIAERFGANLLPQRDVFCIDCKSFFASVEAVQRGLHPLEAKICVVSRDDNRSGLVLASSVQIKKKYQIKTGTRTYEIPLSLSDVLLVKPRMNLYIDMNERINEILLRYVAPEDWHPYSIDEGFIDVTASAHLFGGVLALAQRIQNDIWKELQLVVSIGIGKNPLMAKYALDIEAKNAWPTFISQWDYDTIPEKLWPITDLSDTWGIGRRYARRLEKLRIHSMYDLAHANLGVLKDEFGIIGEQLYYHANGIDYSNLADKFVPLNKGFGKSQILTRDYVNPDEIERVILEMTDQVAARLRKHGLQAASIHLSLGFSKNASAPRFNHQATMTPTSASFQLIEAMLYLFRKHYRGHPVRSIGIHLGSLVQSSDYQLSLFEDPDQIHRHLKLEKSIDQIRQRYGYSSLVRSSSLMSGATAIQRSKLVGGHLG